MNRSRIGLFVSTLVFAASFSCDPENAANLKNEARRALTARGMVVAPFSKVDNYPIAHRAREQVQCAAVSRNESNGRICLASYEDANAALAAVNSKIRMTLPEGSAYFVRGKTIFVVEPGQPRSNSLVQEIHDELAKLP